MTETETEAADEGAEGRGRPSEFEDALEELEQIVARLDRVELELDEALELFERGVSRLRTASRLLDEARGVVEELIRDASGELEAVDFEVPTEEAGAGGED